ncbi:MAG: hydantoinase B/oxoprolinase family protein [Candidatus Rokubacteria bacterium]|nr:hydantoinase B/oxoprolinase family protein [Candidatus Rokubacteria bacterium]
MRETDPATFEVVKNALYCAAEEMKVVLAKTAYSPLLKVAGDYSCGIFDVRGEMVAQGPDLPIHLGSMPLAVKAVIRASATFAPGDVFIHNDPYFGGSHLPDVNVVTPAFHGTTLLGFACVRAHWPDIGSATPGSYGATTEIYGEGLRLPPVRLYTAGVLDRDVEDIIFTNVRTPDERRGDLRAQIAANLRGVTRLGELARKYGTDRLLAIMQEVMDYSERMMRSMLGRLPDGSAVFEDFCDGDGILEEGEKEDAIFWIRMRATKRGDTLTVDFAGTDREVPGPMNAPLAVTASGIYTAIKMVADPTDLVPPNSGCWRPIALLAPPGTVVNAVSPAPVVYANHEISHRVCDMLFGALVTLAPDRVMACSQGTSAILTLGGVDSRTGERYVSYETIKGGFGARPTKDGVNGLSSGISNTMNTPIEILESSFPVRIERYAIVTDSGGPGTYRGGAGVSRTWKILGGPSTASVCLERTKSAPFGLVGGGAGGAGRISVVGPDGVERDLTSKGSFTAPAGSEICLRAPGAGGFGPPAARDPEKLREDVVNGYVSLESAASEYGRRDRSALACPSCARPSP